LTIQTFVNKNVAVVIKAVAGFLPWLSSGAAYPATFNANLDASFASGDAFLNKFFVDVSVAVIV
jgi:hypothetical protein